MNVICESRPIDFHWQARSGQQQPSLHDSSHRYQATLLLLFRSL